MGTMNRQFTPSLHKAMMLNNAHNSGRKYHTHRKEERFEKKTTVTFFSRVRNLVTSFFKFFGFRFGTSRKTYCFPVAKFTTPTHSAPYRSSDQLAKRKARRQKRTKLIMRRGYA